MKNALKKTAAILSCAALALNATCLPTETDRALAATPEATRFEFEDGVLDGCEENEMITWTVVDEDAEGNSCDMTGWSGDGYVYIDQKDASVTVTVTADKDGLYKLDIGYIQCFGVPKKIQYLNVNGSNQGEVLFPFNSGKGWESLTAGYIPLKKGENKVEIKSYWGYTFLDYLEISPAPDYLMKLSPSDTLSNPNADDNTKRLYNYLLDVYGEKVISGQQENCGSHCYNINSYEQSGADFSYFEDNEAEFTYLSNVTGELPAIRGIDFLTYNSTVDYQDYAAERAIEWYNDFNGIPAICWHWCVPSEENGTTAAFYLESANANYTTFSISRALTEGTWENDVLLADIKLIAEKFQMLEDAGVPCLFRPLHEAEGAWFWWGAEGAEYCVELYRLLYEKLTNEYGLNNIIWEWTSSTFVTSADWYPGDDVVDIVSYDKYNATNYTGNLSSIPSTFYSLVASTDGEKMVAMSENDTIPSLDNLVKDKAAWLYFCPWYGNYLTDNALNPADNLKEIYQSEYCVTLDELPDLKEYRLDTSNTENTIMYGDLNSDEEVGLIDLVMLCKYTADLIKLDKNALLAADVYYDGDVDLKDLVKLAKYVAQLITKLGPEG